MGSQTATGFLSRTQSLKVLRLSWATKLYGVGWNGNAGRLITSVANTIGDSLEERTLTAADSLNSLGCKITDMSRFKVLRELNLDLDMLFCFLDLPREYDEESDIDDDEIQNERDSDQAGDASAIPRLVDLVPPTIESVGILMNRWSDDYAGLVPRLLDDFRDDLLRGLNTMNDIKKPAFIGRDLETPGTDLPHQYISLNRKISRPFVSGAAIINNFLIS